MNLGDLVQAVERRAGIAYDRDATIEVINEALQAIAKIRDWGWLEGTWSFTSTGAASYTPPVGWSKVRSVKVGERRWPMIPIDEIDENPYHDGWTIQGDVLVLSPAPAAGVAVVARVYLTEPALEDDTDTPLLPVEWHYGLVNYAAAILLERVDEVGRADRCMARFDTTKRSMIGQALRAKGPHRVRVRPGSLL